MKCFEFIFGLVIGASIVAILLLGRWPVEHDFRHGVLCGVAAIQQLQENDKELTMDDVYEVAGRFRHMAKTAALRSYMTEYSNRGIDTWKK